MASEHKWTLFFSPGFKGDVGCRVTPTDGYQPFNEEIAVVPESRVAAAEAERDALREALAEISHTYTLNNGPDDGNTLRQMAREALAASGPKEEARDAT